MKKTEKLMRLTFGFSIALMSGPALTSCGSNDEKMEVTEEVNTSDYRTTITSVEDVEDNGDPSDISVSFSKVISNDDVFEYRLFYVLSSASISSGEAELTDLKSLNNTHYISINPSQSTSDIRLGATQLSVDGQSMAENASHKLYVLTIGKFNNEEVLVISAASESFSIVDNRVFNEEDYKPKNVVAKDLDNDNNASDFTVSFSGAGTIDEVSEYWIFVVKSTSIANAELETLKLLDQGKFMSVENTATSFEVELSEGLFDSDGNIIEAGNTYQFFVMSKAIFKGEIVHTLSLPSAALEMLQKPETSTLVPDFRGNGAIHIDTEGNLYVNEFGQGQGNAGLGTSAFKISPSGEVDEFVSNLSGPVGNTLDDQGNYYVNNGNEGTSGNFTKIAPDGTQTVLATIDGYPTDILTGTDGNFYIVNWTRNILHRVTPEGAVTVFAEDNRLQGCTGIDYDDQGNILVGNFSSGNIMSLDANGNITVIATIPTVVANFVIGYITYFENHVYATGYGSNKIYKVALTGEVEEFAGDGQLRSIDGELASASFITPNGIAIDPTRRILYVSQNGNTTPTGLRAIPLD